MCYYLQTCVKCACDNVDRVHVRNNIDLFWVWSLRRILRIQKCSSNSVLQQVSCKLAAFLQGIVPVMIK